MNKEQLIASVAEDLGVSKTQSKDAIESVLRQISNGLQEDEQVTLKGFGTFNVRTLPARLGRNPATGAALDIPERQHVGFKAHNALKDAVSISI